MTPHFSTVVAAFTCVLLVSCVPYDESKDKRKKPTQTPPQKTVTSAEQQKIQEQRDALKEKQTATTPQETTPTTSTTSTTAATTGTPSSTGATTPSTPTPAAEKRPEYKFANKVPGKDGFVFSPYNNKVVDVRDIPSGTLVQDPTYTGEGKGYFRVP